MPLPGPFLLVAETPAPDLRAAIVSAGAFPLIEVGVAEAASAVATVKPAAIVVAEPNANFGEGAASDIARHSGMNGAPLIPVIARLADDGPPPIAGALPVPADARADLVMARAAAALRVRALHAGVLRRMEMIAAAGGRVPPMPRSDPLDDTIVLVAGRGRSYPRLAVAAGERAGLIGALSIETAARCLASRDVDGIVIGDGFDAQAVEALFTVVVEDARFRDLPVAALNGFPTGIETDLPNFQRVSGDAETLMRRFLPYARLHAFAARLKRFHDALDSAGILDCESGLLTAEAFARFLAASVEEAREQASGLSLARFSFPPDCDRRVLRDAARLVGKLVRTADFACQNPGGSILAAFTGTDLRSAHVIACRIASVIKHTAVAPRHEHTRAAPMVTLAALKPNDHVGSLMSRTEGAATVAAE